MRNVRNPGQHLIKAVINLFGLVFQRLDPVTNRAYLRLLIRRILTGLLQLGDLAGLRIPLRLQRLRFRQRRAPFLIQRPIRSHIQFIAASCQSRGNGVQIAAKV